MDYTKEFHMDQEEVLTTEVLEEFIQQHRTLVLRYEELDRMYRGEHPILGMEEKALFKPDNRLVVNYAKFIVDTFNGFFMGSPVKVTSESEEVSEYIRLIEKYNDIDDNNADLSKKCSIYGHAFELVFLDEEAQIGVTNIDPKECFIIYDNSIRERPLYGVRYRVDEESKIEGTISDTEKIRYFVIADDGLKYTEEKPNYFGDIPIIEYVENEERMGAFEPVETLINAYNKAISEKTNDVDYFADAYMKILGAMLDEETLQRIRDNRIINMAGQSDGNLVVEFMGKPNADETQENLLDRLEKLIFAISMVANITDETFGTASGIALKYKLLSMSNLANTKERKFAKGFNRRFQLISQVPNAKISPEDLWGIEYQFTRNMPNNLSEEAEQARALKGIVSDKTLLQALSIVQDVDAEVERLEEENAYVNPYIAEQVSADADE